MGIRFKGNLLHLTVEKKRLPNGVNATLEIIRHPGAVLVIPFLTDRRSIFLRQYRPVIGQYLYELPAGTLKKNESLVACAKRELIEETSFAAGKLTRLGKIYPVPGYSTEVIHLFAASQLNRVCGQLDPDEIIKTIVLSRGELRQLFRAGRIVDAKTICALAKCHWL